MCSHAVAVAERTGVLETLIRGVKVMYRSAITYPERKDGAGRKGGRKRNARIYLERPEDVIPAKKSDVSPFTKVWHNNEPLVLTKVEAIPTEKSRCSYCGQEFPRGFLAILPFDVALSHRERWEYLNKERRDESDPIYLQSPAGRMTTKYYCVKRECVFKRFPYFQSELLSLPDDIQVRDSHKNLLREQLDVFI